MDEMLWIIYSTPPDNILDQGTGSTYSALGPYWAKKLGKDRLAAIQPSARGAAATLDCSDSRMVKVHSMAVKVAEGQMLLL